MSGNGWTPVTLRQAFAPMMITNWVLGTSVLEYPPGHLRPGLSIIYHIAISIGFSLVFGESMMIMSKDNIALSGSKSIMEQTAFLDKFLVICGIVYAFCMMLLGWLRRKVLVKCFNRLSALDDSYGNMGFPKSYKKIFILQLCHLGTIAVVITIMAVVYASQRSHKSKSERSNAPIIFCFHYPIVMVMLADYTFVGLVRILGRRFASLNELVEKLAISKVVRAAYPKSNQISTIATPISYEAHDIKVKLRYLQRLRLMHLELCSIACEINEAFGIQNLVSSGTSSPVITALLYGSYILFEGRMRGDSFFEASLGLWWSLVYSIKFFTISHACAQTSNEAQRTGEVIHDLHRLATDKELHEEIQEFSLQMLQYPLSFTACGFFTLDYVFISGVVGAVTTYLVILIQMNSISAPTLETVGYNNTIN